MAPNFLTTAEAAARLGVCRSRVLALIAAGRLPTIQAQPGWPHLIRPADLRLVADRRPGRPAGRHTAGRHTS